MARECHPAVYASPQGVRRSWDWDCNGHRILGRVSCRWKVFRIIRMRRLSRAGDRGGLGGLDILRPVPPHQKCGDTVRSQRGRRLVRRRMNRGRDRNARGSIASAPWEKYAHAHRRKTLGLRARWRSAEAVMGVVKRPVPRSCRAEPKTPWGVHAAKVARASREHARCGCTQFVWVADIGWTHCASSPPGGRKTCW